MTDQPDLYLEFAGLQGDDRYLAFAARWGNLTRDVTVVAPSDPGPAEAYCSATARYQHPPSPPGAESRRQDLANAIRFPAGSEDTPMSHAELLPAREPETGGLWGDHSRGMRDLIERWRDRRAGRAPDDVQRGIETALAGRVAFAFDPVTGMPSHAPADLLGALWLQFAYAVGQAREYRACRQCGRHFPISVAPGAQQRRVRADKLYCGPKCQQATAYDIKKQKRAAARRRARGAAQKGAKAGHTRGGG